LLIGPEGGWTDAEKQDFINRRFPHILLSEFTLRAETAAIVAIAKLMN
jgi:RsmE family RNA methyltransferase